MDNTLVASYKGAIEYAKKLTGKDLKTLDNEELLEDHTDFWLRTSGLSEKESRITRLELFHDVNYWETLPFEEGAYDVFKQLYETYDVFLATSVFKTGSEECMIGKPRWVQKNLRPAPKHIIKQSDKRPYAIEESGKPNLLIDDWSHNVDGWLKSKGEAVLFDETDSEGNLRAVSDILTGKK